MPARADDAWGSDRADALAEEAHRAAYAPPQAATDIPSEAQAAPPRRCARSVLGWLRVAGSGWPSRVPHRRTGGRRRPVVRTTSAPSLAAAGSRRRSVVGLCLLSGLVGGVAGQLLEDRVNLAGSTLPEPGPGATDRPAGSIANIAATALPSVVTIKVDGGGEGAATGSGFILDAKGHILTNNHVGRGRRCAATSRSC